MKYISAKFLLAAPPPETVTIPAGFQITQCPERRARNGHFMRRKGGMVANLMNPGAQGEVYHAAKIKRARAAS